MNEEKNPLIAANPLYCLDRQQANKRTEKATTHSTFANFTYKFKTNFKACLIGSSSSSESLPSNSGWMRLSSITRTWVILAQHSTLFPPVPLGKWTVRGNLATGFCDVSGITMAVPQFCKA